MSPLTRSSLLLLMRVVRFLLANHHGKNRGEADMLVREIQIAEMHVYREKS